MDSNAASLIDNGLSPLSVNKSPLTAPIKGIKANKIVH